MVLSVAVEYIKPDLPTVAAERDVGPKRYPRRLVDNLFTVHVDSKRILTVQTNDDNTAGKWLSQVLRSTASNTKPLKPNADLRPDAIFVGLTAEVDDYVYCPRGAEPPYGVLTISVGSHCLMHRLDAAYPPPKLVKAFFENPRVVVLGRDMANVAKKLKNQNGIEVRNAVDLNELAIRGMKRDDLDLGRYDLDRLAMTVLGKHYDVIRPEEKKLYDFWTRDYDLRELGIYNERLCDEKVKWGTLDAYLCLLIGTALEEAIHGARVVSGAASKKKNKITTTKRIGASK